MTVFVDQYAADPDRAVHRRLSVPPPEGHCVPSRRGDGLGIPDHVHNVRSEGQLWFIGLRRGNVLSRGPAQESTPFLLAQYGRPLCFLLLHRLVLLPFVAIGLYHLFDGNHHSNAHRMHIHHQHTSVHTHSLSLSVLHRIVS